MNEPVRFLLDEHVAPAIVAALRRLGVEATTVGELGRLGADDETHVTWAAAEGWVVFTQDKDFLALAEQTDHAGIAYSRPQSIGRILAELTELHATESRESMHNQVRYLKRGPI